MKKICLLLLFISQFSLYAQVDKDLEKLEFMMTYAAQLGDSFMGTIDPKKGAVAAALKAPKVKELINNYLETAYAAIRFPLPKEMKADFDSILEANRDKINDIINDQIGKVVTDGKKSVKAIAIDVSFEGVKIAVTEIFKGKIEGKWGTFFEDTIIDVLDAAKLGVTIKGSRSIADAVEVGKQSAAIVMKYGKRVAGGWSDYSKVINGIDNSEDRVALSFHITLDEYKELSSKSQLTSKEEHRLGLLHNKLQSDIETYEKLTEIGWKWWPDKSLRKEYPAFEEPEYKPRYSPQQDFISSTSANTMQSPTTRGGSAGSQFENLPQKDYTDLLAATRGDEGVLLVNNPGSSDFNLILTQGDWGKHLQTNVTSFGSINIPSGTALFTLNNLDQIQTDVLLEYVVPANIYSIDVEIVANFIAYGDIFTVGDTFDIETDFFIDIDSPSQPLLVDHDIYFKSNLQDVSVLPAPFDSSARQSGFKTITVENIIVTPGDIVEIQFLVDSCDIPCDPNNPGPTHGIIVDRVTVTNHP